MAEARKATAEAERLRQNEDVKKALEQTTPGEAEARPVVEAKHRVWVVVYGAVLASLLVSFLLFQSGVIPLPGFSDSPLHRLPLAALLVGALLFVGRLVETYAIQRAANPVSRYNLTRIVRLLSVVLVVGVAGTILFGNFYTGLVSLGVVSIIVGLAVQTPMTSFIGWIYILARAPYRVGDRIRIDGATGDVIEVNYLDTTLWEFGGQYLSTDHPSGRIIKFPNSKVLNTMVYNYSWPLFPYIWNEIKFHIAYESDLEFVAETMKQAVMEHRGEEMARRVKVYRKLLSRTPVDELSVKEHPEVIFRVSDNTWLEAIVRYLVDPRHAGGVKTELILEILKRLNAAPDRVMFPKSNTR